jgi:hypothetical protein
MTESDFTNFFLGSSGAGAALVGLLFVAVSISPQSTIWAKAPVERQAMSASAFTALINAFFISLGALIPGGLAGVTLVVSIGALWNTLRLGRQLLVQPRNRLNFLRRGVLLAESLVVYSFELYNGWRLAVEPTKTPYIWALCYVLIGIYAIGLIRAWQLLGVRRQGIVGWLSPLRDLEDLDI